MEQYQEIFERYEKKYVMDISTYHKILPFIEDEMEMDQYGRHTISNIYFDTLDYELIRKSIAQSIYKEKLRLRAYGVPKAEDAVFIEIKKKFDGIVYKRRIPITLLEATRYLYEGKPPKVSGQIVNEVDWMLKRYQISPVLMIAYDRIAMFGKADPSLRVTFDGDIRFRTDCLDLSQGSFGTRILNTDNVLIEVKTLDSLPLWMVRLFSEHNVYPTSFSKYGTCYRDYIMNQNNDKGGIYCAS